MAVLHYTAKAKDSRTLELPEEAKALGLKPGDEVILQLLTLPHVQPLEQKANADTKPPKKPRVSAMGKHAGVLSSEEFIRRKQEDIAREDRPRR